MMIRFGFFLGLSAAASLSAQPAGEIHDVVVAAPIGTAPAGGANVQFFRAHDAFSNLAIKGQPYTAEATTEVVRVLADGTRVTNKNSSSMARDKDGRTRRENTFGNIGPWATAGQQAPRVVTISDPVSKEVYILDMNAKTYRKVKSGQPAVWQSRSSSQDGKEVVEKRVEVVMSDRKGEAGMFTAAVPAPAAAGAVMFHDFDPKNAKKENLGRQNMEGVMVDGTRETVTIPAGEIGNDRPIVSVTENWYSPELQMVISTKTNDPQFGESTYRVSNLRRGEPNADLFKVPADFKPAADVPMPGIRMRTTKEPE